MAGRSPKSVPAYVQTRTSPHTSALDPSSISLNTVFDRMGGYIAILSIDGTVIDINSAPLTASGFRRDDVVGHLFWETPFWNGHPKEQEAVRTAISDAAEGHSSQGEWAYYTADGTERFAARYVTPIHDDRRNVRMIVAEGQDITDRVHAERNLLESQQRLYRLVHHVPEAIVMLDCDSGNFMDANEAAQALFGRSREEMKQIGPIDVSPPMQPNGRDAREYAREMIDLAPGRRNP